MPSTEVRQKPETPKTSPDGGAIEHYIENGELLRFNDLKVWHGRASSGEDWKIESFSQYRPSRNIYEGTLYGTLNKEDAQDFANARARRSAGAEPSLHQIVALSDESLILDGGEVNNIVLPSEVVGSPKKFAQKQSWYSPDLKPAIIKLMENRVSFIELQEIEKVASDLDVDFDKLREYAAVINGYFSLTHAPLGKSIAQMLYSSDFFQLRLKGQQPQLIETSPDFTRDVLRRNHIIGSKDHLRSATLGRKIRDVVVIWDFDAVQDREVHEKGQKAALGRAGIPRN